MLKEIINLYLILRKGVKFEKVDWVVWISFLSFLYKEKEKNFSVRNKLYNWGILVFYFIICFENFFIMI